MTITNGGMGEPANPYSAANDGTRTDITAIPCRPIAPLTITESPGRARSGPGSNPSLSLPIPVVFR